MMFDDIPVEYASRDADRYGDLFAPRRAPSWVERECELAAKASASQRSSREKQRVTESLYRSDNWPEWLDPEPLTRDPNVRLSWLLRHKCSPAF